MRNVDPDPDSAGVKSVGTEGKRQIKIYYLKHKILSTIC
jgi:hypothetical protein